tara:strand:+ start:4125 stop:4862 length:738 start_codon:yes stop_codon:yes gene_type:complete
MIRQFYTFLFFYCFFLVSQITAQEVIVKKRNVETGEFYSNSRNYKKFKNKSNAKEKYTNCIKYNFLPFFIGEFPMGYEIRINPFITLEAGLGLTTNNHMDQLVLGWEDFYSNDNGALRNTISLSRNATIKIFPEGNSYNNGLYVGIDYKNRPYSKILPQENFSQKATKLFIDIGLIAGYHIRSSDRILIDLYAGMSQRYITWDKVTLFSTIDPNTNELVAEAEINEREKYSVLGVLLGFKIGYLF